MIIRKSFFIKSFLGARKEGFQCSTEFNDFFAELSGFQNNGKNIEWEAKFPNFALSGIFNPKRAFETDLYLYEQGTFRALEEMNSKNLAQYESYSMNAAWPQLKNGNIRVTTSFEVERKPAFRANVNFSSQNAHSAFISIPAIGLNAKYNFAVQMKPTFMINYVHMVQMNAKKITKTIRSSGYRVNPRNLNALIASRNQIYHEFSITFPTNRACSTYRPTPENSLYSKLVIGSNKACFSGSQGHVAIHADPSDASAKFDFFSGLDLESQEAVWYINSVPLKSEILGQWDLDISDQQISIMTGVSLAGTAVETPIETQFQVLGKISGNDIISRIDGKFNEESFSYELNGQIAETRIAGTTQNSLTINIPNTKENVLGLKQIMIFLDSENLPIGVSVAQSDYLVQWLVDTQAPLIFLNVHNDDKVCVKKYFIIIFFKIFSFDESNK